MTVASTFSYGPLAVADDSATVNILYEYSKINTTSPPGRS